MTANDSNEQFATYDVVRIACGTPKLLQNSRSATRVPGEQSICCTQLHLLVALVKVLFQCGRNLGLLAYEKQFDQ